MKDNREKENTKDVIAGLRVNRESIYYTSLFGAAFIVSLVLLCIAISQHNKALTIYASVLVPVFLISTLIAVRFTCFTKNRIHIKDGTLVIKTFFTTRKFSIKEIKKITFPHSEGDYVTLVNITYYGKTFRYNFKNLKKEDAMRLKHMASKK